MIDEQSAAEPPKGEQPIRREDLVRYLDAHNVRMECPHCGTSNWGHFNESALEGTALTRLGGDALVYPDSILPTLVLICTNCAYIWPIARKAVAAWLADNPEKPA